MRADSGEDCDLVDQLEFLDAEGNVCHDYNPYNKKLTLIEHRMAENEELIGVYGVIGEYDSLDSFGFIVKVTCAV